MFQLVGMGETTGMLYTVDNVLPTKGTILSTDQFQQVFSELKLHSADSNMESIRKQMMKSKQTIKHNTDFCTI